MLNFFEELTGRYENVLHTPACLHLSNPLDAAGRQETFTARVAFATEASSPIAVISTSQGAEDSTHCSALLQGTAPAEEMDPLIQDK